MIAFQIDHVNRILRCITRDGRLLRLDLPAAVPEMEPSAKLAEQWADVPIEHRGEFMHRARDLDISAIPAIADTYIRGCGISKDGKTAFAIYRDGYVRLWDAESAELLKEIPTATSSVRCIDMTADGSLLGYRDKFGTIVIYRVADGEKQEYPRLHRKDLSSIAFSPDGNTFATMGDDGVARIWDTATGEALIEPLYHDMRGDTFPHYCRFSPDGSTLVTWGESDRAFRVWDAEQGDSRGAPILCKGVPKLAHFDRSGAFITLVEETDRNELTLQTWSLDTFVPVTPKTKTTPEELNLSSVAVPDATPFTADELDQIEFVNGLQKDDRGISEVDFPASESTSLPK